ncbi:MAG: NAD(P)-dependent alcohol dehydrogenase [Planctomycetota bacterium]
MFAAVCPAYGIPEVVRFEEVARPTAKPRQVRVRVVAAAVTSGDARIRAARFPAGFSIVARMMLGLRKPRQPILGSAVAGYVDQVGAQVTRFHGGEPVFAFSGIQQGAHAEYLVLDESAALAPMPENCTPEQAAAIPFGGTTALFFLRDRADLQSGETLLVNGASGAVGIAAIQLGKHFGARVTAVCSSANRELALALGADQVIDYRTVDFRAGGQRWDVIMDNVGNITYGQCKQVLNEGGRFLNVVSSFGELLAGPLQSMFGKHKVLGGVAPERAQDMALLRDLTELGVLRPVVDSVYPWQQIHAAYHRVDTGRKVGSVILRIMPPEAAPGA